MGQNDDRHGAIEGKDISVGEPKIGQSHGKKNSRYGVRDEGERVQKPPEAHLRSNDDPGDQHAENHRNGGYGKHEDRRVDERPGPRIIRNRDVVLKRKRG